MQESRNPWVLWLSSSQSIYQRRIIYFKLNDIVEVNIKNNWNEAINRVFSSIPMTPSNQKIQMAGGDRRGRIFFNEWVYPRMIVAR